MFIKPKLPLWLPWHAPLTRHPDGIRLLRAPSGALANACCCDVVDCERFRGVAEAGDEHTHDPYVWVEMTDWDERAEDHFTAAQAGAECCLALNDIYELPIRDYDTATALEWAQFDNQPGMFMPTCIPCHNCFEEDETWAVLRAACGDCDYPYGSNCIGNLALGYIPVGHDLIWTVTLEVWGYWDTVCTSPTGCTTPTGNPKVFAMWIKTLPSSGAPHNHAGLHDLTLVVLDSPIYQIGPPEIKFHELYCTVPNMIKLHAGDDPEP